MLVGVWPWGKLRRLNPGRWQCTFVQRMFDHRTLSDSIVHPYDVENKNSAKRNVTCGGRSPFIKQLNSVSGVGVRGRLVESECSAA